MATGHRFPPGWGPRAIERGIAAMVRIARQSGPRLAPPRPRVCTLRACRTAGPPRRGAPAPPAQPASVNLGDTVDQVMAALGQPEVIADLNRKLVFLYPDLKVTFIEGRVADVK